MRADVSNSAVLSSFFAGKTVLITGASSGLGKALALKVAAISSTGKTITCSPRPMPVPGMNLYMLNYLCFDVMIYREFTGTHFSLFSLC